MQRTSTCFSGKQQVLSVSPASASLLLDAQQVSKMMSRGVPCRDSRGASFSQILKKNAASLPGTSFSYLPMSTTEDINNNLLLHPATSGHKLKTGALKLRNATG
ncbi:hypothetical protein SKAU_G00031470 [Synaphobranchus kaupii]|uniref:Uncharacterized protein n=1 Tax=Synaphobranchus kaupii TaxID=118154 RepID=A0A9Q1GDX2_SYNKA|nr:hypothetical protein SKAU_G00031470 [Synaphobranchus kaupii]